MLLNRALHIIFMVTWFAGLFYLPRLFIYHVQGIGRSAGRAISDHGAPPVCHYDHWCRANHHFRLLSFASVDGAITGPNVDADQAVTDSRAARLPCLVLADHAGHAPEPYAAQRNLAALVQRGAGHISRIHRLIGRAETRPMSVARSRPVALGALPETSVSRALSERACTLFV